MLGQEALKVEECSPINVRENLCIQFEGDQENQTLSM